MLRASLGIMAISCTLLFVPFALAQTDPDQKSGAVENRCASVSDVECDHQELVPALTHEQLESVQIELLERGFVTNFNLRTEADRAKLADAVAKFQAANNMPATGRIDVQTMSALGLPNPKSAIGTDEVERAKPSK